jgi:hypothetical protein
VVSQLLPDFEVEAALHVPTTNSNIVVNNTKVPVVLNPTVPIAGDTETLNQAENNALVLPGNTDSEGPFPKLRHLSCLIIRIQTV